MKLTKKQEKDILKIYDTWMHGYLNGDVDTYNYYLDKDYHFIGSTNNEEFLNRRATTGFFKKTADQLSGKTEIRNDKKIMETLGDLVFITHLLDAWFKAGSKWNFYGRFRFTNVLHETPKGWRFIYQHYSTPDNKAQEGETIGYDQISAENLQLRDAIKRRTKELEEKNKELEIESALESVRSVAMGMKKRDDMLKICKAISQQLKKLGVKEIRNVQTAIFYPDKGTYMNYEYYAKHNKTFITDVSYKTHRVQQNFAKKMMTCEGASEIKQFKGKKLKDWYAYQKTTNQFADKYLLTTHSLNYYWYSLGAVAMGISTYQPLSKEELELFARFRNVFELAYKRYIDIEKAEARAREAQIEAALEKVRSRSLAMHKSNELQEVVNTVFDRLKDLKIDINVASIFIFNEGSKDWEQWVATSTTNYSKFFHIPYTNNLIFKDLEEAKQKSKDFYSVRYSFEQKNEWFSHAFKNTEYRQVPDDRKKYILKSKFFLVAFALSKHSGIQLAKYEGKDFSQEENEILKRFSRVFEQAYIRFLDLKKAESQAREAQIEAALERVRSRSMAMHKSDEVAAVASVLFHQLQQLDLPNLRRCLIGIVNEKKARLQSWHTSLHGDSTHKVIDYPIDGHPVIKKKIKGWRKGKPFSIELSPAELKDFIKYIVKHGFEFQKGEKHATKLIQNHATFRYGYLEVATHEPITDQDFELVQRFARVFEQTYTRFLDLQKAEVQAREAEIQLALERVRARTMAMHKSEELQDVASLLYKEFQGLGVTSFLNCGYVEVDEENKVQHAWMTSPDGHFMEKFNLPLTGEPTFQARYNAWKNQVPVYHQVIGGSALVKHIEVASLHFGSEDVEKMVKSQFPDPTIFYCGNFSKGYLHLVSGNLLTREQESLFDRFTRAFEMTYKRFIDLQKAETQAREAQIEAALERVRSRAMAMHKTDDLQEVVRVVAEELKNTGVILDTWGAVICTYFQDSKDVLHWTATEDPVHPSIPYLLPYFKDELFDEAWTSKIRGDDYFAKVFSYEVKNAFFNYAFEHSDYRQLPDEYKKIILESENHGLAWAWAKNSAIMIPSIQGDLPSEEEKEILIRFAKVFEQSFIRFLDLKKAEAQAKEAKIESALERVRSRSLAMHHSSELSSVVDTLLREFTNLEFTLTFCIINLIDEQDRSNTVWAANPETGKLPESYYMKFEDYPFHHAMWDAWKAQKKNFIYTIEGEEKKIYDEYLFTKTEFRRFPKHVQEVNKALKRYVAGFTFFKYSGLQTVSENQISEDELKILERFGRVFEQTYTRFLDLQKAEAQTREAQIEAALERVRSRTMGMQRSDELQEAAVLLFQQVIALGVPAFGSGFNIWDDGRKSATAWMAGRDRMQPPFKTSSSEDIFLRIYEAAEKGESLYVEEQGGEALKEHYEYMKSIPVFKQIADKMASVGQTFPTFQIMHCAFFSHGYLMFISFEPVPDAYDIFKRFAKVFEQTYTRFLDLQKAEAQAREAQIEAALEKVRSRTMGMQKSEELKEVIQLVYEQFVHLKINVEHTGFIIDYKERDDLHIWLADQREIPSEITIPCFDSPPNNSIREAKEKEQDFFTYLLTFEEKNKFYKDLFKFIRNVPEESLEYYFNCSGLAGSGVLLENVGLYIENFSGTPYTDEDNKTLMRFGKVFQQTYTRFLDLQKAEAQAREAQIELALERVRASAMAMHNSNDVGNATAIMFTELEKLGVETIRCGIDIMNNSKIFEVWASTSSDEGKVIQIIGKLDSRIHPHLEKVQEAWEKQDKFILSVLEGKDLEYYYKKLSASSDYQVPVTKIPSNKQFNYVFFFKEGGLFTYRLKPFTDEEIRILQRFTSVFGLTYRRYLDLQKAEAQAREAEIQLALERVRARAMAMQKSTELAELVATLFNQLNHLDFALTRCYIYIIDPESLSLNAWTANTESGGLPECYFIKYLEVPYYKAMINAWRKREQKFVYELGGNEKIETDRILFSETEYKRLPENVKSGMISVDRVFLSFSFNNYGALQTGGLEPLSKENLDILSRFGKIFDQNYTRFLDLQKAEAQTREAQIEAALERVRAKAMAMHSSKDLAETIEVFYRELKSLGVIPRRCGVALVEKETRLAEVSTMNTTEKGDSVEVIGKIKMIGHPVLENIFDHWILQKEYHTVLRGNQIKDYYQVLKPQISYPDYPHDAVQFGYYFMFKEGDVYAWTDKELIEEELKIFRRFTTVISLTYKRYIDLQQAESQAREAEIQLALERVRARTMAMHNSEELSDTASVLFQEIKKLGIESFRGGLCIIDYDEDTAELWLSNEIDGKTNTRIITTVTTEMHHMYKEWFEAGRQKKPFYIKVMNKKELAEYYEAVSEYLQLPPKKEYNEIEVYHGFFFDKGTINVISLHQLTKDECNIMLRFANVFEQTYTRFLDLQKAEAQAREAQIEAALERVRAKAMAMHNTEDISAATTVVFNELIRLGITLDRCGIAIFNEPPKMEIWSTSLSQEKNQVVDIVTGNLNSEIHPMLWGSYQAWKNKKNFYSYELNGIEVKNYYDLLENQPEYHFPKVTNYAEHQILNSFFFNEGAVFVYTQNYLPKEWNTIFQRFTKVFSLTYQRYQDLKNAEARAREAQIEAALERVRAKTMAMHKSEQLAETAKVLFEQFELLGIFIDRMSIGIINEKNRTAEFWLTDQAGNKLENEFFFSLDEPTSISKIYKAWNSKKEFITIDLIGQELDNWLRYVKEEVKLPIDVSNIKGRRVHQVALFSFGFLMFTTSQKVSDENIQILVRFAKVFDLTYTRFRDLQKAEAQSRESEIQLALERVRARTMAMYKSDELADAAAVVFQQLINLGIEPNRIYIAIIRDDEGNVEFWITDEDGTKVSSAFETNLNDNRSFKKMFEGWKNKDKSHTIDMQGDELQEYFNHLTKLGVPFKDGLFQKRRLQYIAYFSKGFIGVASPDETKSETLPLLERFADVFNLTYTRFNDLLQSEAQNKIIQAENERKTKELEDARELQLSMLPKELPLLPHLDIAVYMKTATEVGGDYYDFNIDNNGTLTFIVGDATGHGMMSGMMVSIMKSFFIANRKNIELKEFFESSNNSIKDMKLGRLMMALSAIQITSEKVIATNAGMPSLIYYRNKSQKAGEFVSHNFPLGAMKGNKYLLKEINYELGDVILLMSDGFAELINKNNEQYGYTRIKEQFRTVASKSSNEIVNHLKNSASEWINGVEPNDDVTFVVVKVI